MLIYEAPLLFDLGIKALLIAVITYFSIKFKITSVPILILAGVIISGLLASNGVLFGIAETGIVLLFFLLGLEYPLNKMISIARRIWFGGTLDVLINLVLPMLLAFLYGFNLDAAFLLGGVTYASSSSITLKMLEEKRRFANPESDYMIALLVFEDIVAPLAVTLISVLYIQGQFTLGIGFSLILKVILLISVSLILARFLFRRFKTFFEKIDSQEIFLIFGISIALLYSGVSLLLGLSELLGAFLAGVMLAELNQTQKFEKNILPVRNILLPFFFIWFGSNISLADGAFAIPFLIFLLIWAIIGKIIVGFIGGQVFGLSPRVALRGGLSLVQRGEFSVVIAALAIPEVRSFGGIYILITAFLGMIFFSKAPKWSKLIDNKFGLKSFSFRQE